ncbi:hypothetical protein KIW84_041483 [Lathyrus oleraceus]|uniref:Uncharacterized protein n=1 Tax=Pisum sativum TaxID=3888 RepID=A0A9D4XA64_PEA|nr:hypothetical protein KIW84_041483 [Pisum sativum]
MNVIYYQTSKAEELEHEDEDEMDFEEEEEGRKKRVVTVTDLYSRPRSKAGGSNTTPCCQVENCDADLSEAKQYHRRHKVGYSSPTQDAIRKDLSLSLAEFMIVIGGSTTFIFGTILSWRALSIIGLIPTAVLLLGLFFIPESPRWLAKRGLTKDFVAALQILRGKDADISQEAKEIQIGVGLMVCQQFGGINGVGFYASSIFDLAGFPSATGTILFAILQIVITGVGAALIDKAGRKPLLLVSGSGLVTGSIFTAVAFYLKVHLD